MAHLSGNSGGKKTQPKKSTYMDDWYLLQEEKRQRLQRELEQKKKEAAQKAAAQKESAVLPPWINPDEYDPVTGGIDPSRNIRTDLGNTSNNSKPAARDASKNNKPGPGGTEEQKTPSASDEAVPDTVLPKESGERNTIQDESIIEIIRNAAKYQDRETLIKEIKRLFEQNPDVAVFVPYDNQFQLVLMDSRVHVLGNGDEAVFADAQAALRYIDRQNESRRVAHFEDLTDEIQVLSQDLTLIKRNNPNYQLVQDELNAKYAALKSLGVETMGGSGFNRDYQIIRYNKQNYVIGNGISDTGYLVTLQNDDQFHVLGNGIDAGFDTPNDAQNFIYGLTPPERPANTNNSEIRGEYEGDMREYATVISEQYARTAEREGKSFSNVFWDTKTDWTHPIPVGWDYWEITPERSQRAARITRDKETDEIISTRDHAGIDFRVSQDTPVIAMTGGTVIGHSPYFYGGTEAIEVLCDDGTIIRYCEISTDLTIGDQVSQGQYIGKTIKNNKGKSNMLHLEVYAGTGEGYLTNRSNKGDLTYVTKEKYGYQRRADLLDPFRAQDLRRINGEYDEFDEKGK